jgi:hypothetical protein
MNNNHSKPSNFGNRGVACRFAGIALPILFLSWTISTIAWAQAIPRRVTTFQPGSPTVVVPMQQPATASQIKTMLDEDRDRREKERFGESLARKKATEDLRKLTKKTSSTLSRINRELGLEPEKEGGRVRTDERSETRDLTVRGLLIRLDSKLGDLDARIRRIENSLGLKPQSKR